MTSLARKEHQSDPQSPARQRLAGLLEQREAGSKRMTELQAALSRLAGAQRAESEATTRLAALDAEEAAATREWAMSPSGAPPAFDGERRRALTAAIADAKTQAVAASAAHATLSAEYQNEAAALKRIDVPISHAIGEIIAEEGDSLLADLTNAKQALAIKAQRVTAAATAIADLGHAGGEIEAMRPLFARLEALNKRIHVALALPAPDADTTRSAAATWDGFISRLQSDAKARVE